MSIIKISDVELDKRILEMLKGGGYKNAVIESFKDIASKRAVTRSIARLRKEGQIAVVHGSGDPELGTYYEAIHWIGDKPLLGPAKSSEWTPAMAAYKADHDRWTNISSWVMIARCEARGVGFFVLCMFLIPAIVGLFVNAPKFLYQFVENTAHPCGGG